jgi:hypothetical protein
MYTGRSGCRPARRRGQPGGANSVETESVEADIPKDVGHEVG